MCAFLDNRLGIAPARKMNIKPIPSLLYLPHIYQTSPGRNIPSEPYFITPHMPSMATLNFVGTRLPLHLTLKNIFSTPNLTFLWMYKSLPSISFKQLSYSVPLTTLLDCVCTVLTPSLSISANCKADRSW